MRRNRVGQWRIGLGGPVVACDAKLADDYVGAEYAFAMGVGSLRLRDVLTLEVRTSTSPGRSRQAEQCTTDADGRGMPSE